MSRTYRQVPTQAVRAQALRSQEKNRAASKDPRTKIQTATNDKPLVNDGKQEKTWIIVRRDNRVTGLRTADHRRGRREARYGLSDPQTAENVQAGKKRRYINRHGEYDL